MRATMIEVVLALAMPVALHAETVADTVRASLRETKVLLVGIDGLRAEALGAAETPNLDRLIAEGAFTDRALAPRHTVSGPGWSAFLCGVWEDKHRNVDNRFLAPNHERYPSVLALAKRAEPELVTASFTTWKPLDETILVEGIDLRHFHDYTDDGDQRMTEQAASALRHADVDLVFFYLADVDETGHAHGFHPDVPEYRAAIERADAQVGRVIDAIESRSTWLGEDWLIIVSTDHGGSIDRNHGRDVPDHRRIPLIVGGDAALRGRWLGSAALVDIAPTALRHLGIAPPGDWGLDGSPVGLRLAPGFGVNLLRNPGAELQSAPADPARDPMRGDLVVAGWEDLGAATIVAYGTPDGYPTADDPGPPSRGRNLFVGGDAGESALVQAIDLRLHAERIDAGRLRLEAGGFFGGFAMQDDVAWLEVRCLDADGRVLAFGRTTAVLARERLATFPSRLDPEGNPVPTGLIERRLELDIPPGTRALEATLRFERHEGLCDGYADELDLRILERTVPPPAAPALGGGSEATRE